MTLTPEPPTLYLKLAQTRNPRPSQPLATMTIEETILTTEGARHAHETLHLYIGRA